MLRFDERVWTRGKIEMADEFDDGWTNVMFVGRVIPNKKFEDVIRAFHAYRTRHNPRTEMKVVKQTDALR